MSAELVLVTGGTGFVGAHCIVALLAAGYRVRTTVRSADRADDARAMVAAAGEDPSGIEFGTADLLRDSGWPDAVRGSEYVLHVASPAPRREPRHADELIVPAREGTLRVLRAARDAGVKRVVLTSSFAAIGYGSPPVRTYTEDDWTDVSRLKGMAYLASKTLAERAAWDFIGREGGSTQLSTVNPVPIFGPPLGSELSVSVATLLGLLNGDNPGVPRGTTMAVDVRDVADLHVRAMVHPDAAGERFLAVSGDPISFLDLATLLRERLGATARRVPTRVIPDWIVRLVAAIRPDQQAVLQVMGPPRRASGAKAERVLGWSPRPPEEAILASALRLAELGLIRS